AHGRATRGDSGCSAGWTGRAVLRTPRRRSAGRSLTMAEETLAKRGVMSSRTRVIVLSISAPVIAFAIVGGLLGKVMAREDTFQHLKVFDDVVGLITNNYVEKVDFNKVMAGAMHGLADGLDPDSAYLTADEVKLVESNAALPAGDVGLEL